MNLIDKLKALREIHQSFGHNLGVEVYNKAIKKCIEIVEAHDPFIDVDDELPPLNENGVSDEVILRHDHKDGFYHTIATRDDVMWYTYNAKENSEIISWMPIPKTTKP